jgi:hypothetical protein
MKRIEYINRKREREKEKEREREKEREQPLFRGWVKRKK